MTRTLRELVDLREPAWPLVLGWLREATNVVEVLPATDPNRADALVDLQVTTRSPMGAIVYESGGLLVDGGWIRVLGSGHPRLSRSLAGWNFKTTWQDRASPPGWLLVADDVVGGFFAIDGGALGSRPGNVNYFAPDRLEWEDLDRGYTDFLDFVLSGDLEEFYEGMRWPEWREEVARLGGDEVIGVYPPLWTRGPGIADRHRGVVPVLEAYELQLDVRRQLGGGAECR